jgi:hypothetical protein
MSNVKDPPWTFSDFGPVPNVHGSTLGWTNFYIQTFLSQVSLCVSLLMCILLQNQRNNGGNSSQTSVCVMSNVKDLTHPESGVASCPCIITRSPGHPSLNRYCARCLGWFFHLYAHHISASVCAIKYMRINPIIAFEFGLNLPPSATVTFDLSFETDFSGLCWSYNC